MDWQYACEPDASTVFSMFSCPKCELDDEQPPELIHVSVADSSGFAVNGAQTFTQSCSGIVQLACLGDETPVDGVLLLGGDDVAPPCRYGRFQLALERAGVVLTGLELARFAGVTNISEPEEAGTVFSPTPILAFSNAVALPDGRVLLSGGFQMASYESGNWTLSMPSDLAFVWDADSGDLRQTSTRLNLKRAFHSAVYIPQSDTVLLAGGVSQARLDADSSCFPWDVEPKVGDQAPYTYEVFDCSTERFLAWDSVEWGSDSHEFPGKHPRVLPTLLPDYSGAVLVVGGSPWDSCLVGVVMAGGYHDIHSGPQTADTMAVEEIEASR